MAQRRPIPDVAWASDDIAVILGVSCPHCHKQIFLQDLGRKSYEAYCYQCALYDPGKYRTIQQAVTGSREYFSKKRPWPPKIITSWITGRTSKEY